jgi:hypothetical protein
VGSHKPSLPPVPEDAADRAARRVAAEKKKEKKDAEKARAPERMQARDALERRRRRQERDGLPREPSPETPDDDDDDDDDDDEEDDMAARLGLSPDLRLGQGSSSQPPSGLAPSVSGAGTSGSRSEERGQAEGVLDPLAEIVEVTPGSQADPPVPQEPLPVPTAQEVDPRVIVSTLRRTVPSAPRAPEAGMVPKPAAGQTMGVPAGTEARGASPQARLVVAQSGYVSEDSSVPAPSSCVLILLFSFFPANGGTVRPVWLLERPLRRHQLLRPVLHRASPAGWPLLKVPSSRGLRRHRSPWGELRRPTPPSRRLSCRGRLLAWLRPRARQTCCRCWHRLLPRLLPFWPWSHPSPPTLRWPRRRYLMPRRRGAQNRDPSWGAATSPLHGAVPTGGISRSGSGPVALRIPSSFLTMSERSSLGMGFVSVPRQRWGRFGRPWRSFAGTFPRSFR